MRKAAIRGKRHKYGAIRTTVDGITFASKAEAKRWTYLRLLEKSRTIRMLIRQPRYPLMVGKEYIGDYAADFAYQLLTETGGPWVQVVEDVKGMDTPLSKWKRRHVRAQYGIDVEIVKR